MASETGNEGWRPMAGAPKDGTRIIVTVRPAEQGPAEVDVAFWARADRHFPDGWRAADSSAEHPVTYAEAELRGWMPMPVPQGGSTITDRTELPEPWEGEELSEESGSGI